MANYVKMGRFGDDLYSPTYDASGMDYPNDVPISPGMSSDEGGGGIDWGAVGAAAITAGAAALPIIAGQVFPQANQATVGAAPVGTGVVTARPGTIGVAGSISSSVLLVGGLGLAALFLFRKK
jgi:hypothetical protein